jgi:type VI secretion system protein ImpC
MAKAKQEEGAAAVAEGEGSLLDSIVSETKMSPNEDSYAVTKKGLQLFIDEMIKPEREGQKVSAALVDELIASLDKKLSKQVDAILHNEDFKKLESAWRGLKYLVDQTDFRENIKVEIVNIDKASLLEDFEDSPEIVRSGLYKLAYTREYGQFGGNPYGMIMANYDFGPGPQDISLLENVASVATMCHAPFISAASEKFFGVDSFEDVPNLKDLQAIFEGPQYTKWRSFRDSEDARSVGLAMPRFLLRLPFGEANVPAKTFNYEEDVTGSHQDFAWGNAAWTFAANVHQSFAKYRWCTNIIGPLGGGAVEGLPVYLFESMGAIDTKIPTEVLLSDRREFELAEQGFMALTMRKGSDNAAFFSANSCQRPKTYADTAEGRAAQTNYALGTQLPYLFIVNRLAHYIKVIQRENIGTWKERTDLERELNAWISQYVADMDNPQADVRSRRPLRKAAIEVSDVDGNPGWYKVGIKVRPHMKYMGAHFTLSLVGKLDKD